MKFKANRIQTNQQYLREYLHLTPPSNFDPITYKETTTNITIKTQNIGRYI